ncbi:MAG: hypothetical protein AAFY76_01005 [Cyanobacteria bacterium J06649_11]
MNISTKSFRDYVDNEIVTEDNAISQNRQEYYPIYNIVEGNNRNANPVIQPWMYIECLKNLGFQRMDVGNKSFLIRIDENVIEEVSDRDVLDGLVGYLKSFPNGVLPDGLDYKIVLNKVYHQIGKYTGKLLERLNTDPNLRIQDDSKEKVYFYYQNGFVEVTKSDIKLMPYSYLKGKIWRGQILPREFKVIKSNEQNNWARFVRNIANNWKVRWYDTNQNSSPNPEREKQLKQIIGYALHGYFDGKLKAIVLTDSRMEDEASGRSGKTLLIKGIGHMLNSNEYSKTFVEVNGKDFKPDDKFKWQELGLETKLVHLNDCQANFDFEQLFNDITEGFKSQHKQKSPFKVLAKLFLSSNRTIRLNGESAKDRSLEFELADYYSADHGPDQEFGQWFFSDWTNEEWLQFDNYMIQCCQLYLENGLEVPDTINLEARKLQEETSLDFVEFMNDVIEYENPELLKRYEWLCHNEKATTSLKDEFCDIFPEYNNRKFTTTKFNTWLEIFSKYHPGLIYRKKAAAIRKSSGKRLFSFQAKLKCSAKFSNK